MPTDGSITLSPAAVWRNMQILFAALAASLGIYGFVIYFLTSQSKDPPAPPGIMLPVFGVVALSILGVSVVLKAKVMPPLSDERSDRPLDDVKPTPAESAALSRLFTASLLSWSLSEAVGILGLMLSFQTHDLNLYLPFVALSAIGFGIHRPQREIVQRVLEAARNAPAPPTT